MIELIIKYNGNIEPIITSLNGTIEILNSTIAIIQIPTENLSALQGYTEIEYIEYPKILFYMREQGKLASCISVGNNNIDNLSGQGVIVGIIDSGIDVYNREFQNADGTTRIDSIYEVNGQIYTREDINSNIINHIDYYGHGTQVAGIAVGRNGIAYNSDIIAVQIGVNQFFASTTDIMRGIKFIVNRAIELSKPVAINISYGTNDGPHDGNSLFEEYINDVSQSYRISIVVAMGNEGNKAHHYSGQMENNRTLEIEFRVSNDISNLYLSLWHSFIDDFEIELFSPNNDKGGPMNKNNLSYRYRLGNTTANIIFQDSTPYNIDNEIFIRLEGADRFVDSGIWRIRLYPREIVNGNINIWLPVNEAVGGETLFIEPNVNTTLTIPATSNRVISVGAYNSLNVSVVGFSGRGYTRATDYIKPDIVAPGVNILTTSVGGSATAFTGTSAATPFVTGSVALLMEWGIVNGNDLFLYGERLKVYLCRGANRSNNMTYPNREWGYGRLCLRQTLNLLKENEKGPAF